MYKDFGRKDVEVVRGCGEMGGKNKNSLVPLAMERICENKALAWHCPKDKWVI